MALLHLEEDSWLLEYESCEKLYRDIMESLSIRQRHQKISEKYLQLSATIRLRLKQYNNEVSQLHKKLEVAAKSGNITPAESERRTRQIETLHSKAVQVKKIFDDQVLNKSEEDRKQLVGSSSSSEWDGSRRPWMSNSSVMDIKISQQRLLEEQNTGLENLSGIISRQKNIAHTISNEVDFHNEILEDLGNHMDQTDQRVRTEIRHIDVVDKKDNTCIYWIFIVLLFISIVVVAVL